MSLAQNWHLLKHHLLKDWKALCLLPYSCSAAERLLGTQVNVDYIGVRGRNSITATCLGGSRDNTACQLALSNFAGYFSTAKVSQFEFGQDVSDAMDALPVGHTKTMEIPPVELVVQHPTSAKWQFTVRQPGT